MSESPVPKPVSEFATVARGLVLGLTKGLIGTARDLELQLVRLHFCALRLPPVAEVPGRVEHPPPPTPRLDLSWLPDDLYWDVFDPLAVVPDEPVAKSLADDLVDICCELSRGLELYDAGEVQAAWWEWRYAFHGHWGQHLHGAQRALFLLARR